MSTDITLGWTKEGAAGYAMDANCLTFLGKGIVLHSAGVFTNYKAIDLVNGDERILVTYRGDTYTGIEASRVASGGPFGRAYISIGNSRTGAAQSGSYYLSSINSGTPITMRGYIRKSSSANTSVQFFTLASVTKVSGLDKHVYLCYSGTTLLIAQGNPDYQSTLATVSGVADGWHYITMLKNGSTVTVFLDGSQVAQISLPGTPNATYTIYPLVCRAGANSGFGFSDVNVNSVLKDGSFVPGNDFGY